jgi:hypothetical protein
VSGVSDAVGAFQRGERAERGPDSFSSGGDAQLGGRSQEGILVGALGRAEAELCTSGEDGPAHGKTHMAARIVDDDDVGGLQRRRRYLFDMGAEALAGTRLVDDGGGVSPTAAQGRQERQRPTAAVRRLGQELLAPRRGGADPIGSARRNSTLDCIQGDPHGWQQCMITPVALGAPHLIQTNEGYV